MTATGVGYVSLQQQTELQSINWALCLCRANRCSTDGLTDGRFMLSHFISECTTDMALPVNQKRSKYLSSVWRVAEADARALSEA